MEYMNPRRVLNTRPTPSLSHITSLRHSSLSSSKFLISFKTTLFYQKHFENAIF